MALCLMLAETSPQTAALLLSLKVGACATVVALLPAMALSYWLARTASRLRPFVEALVILPMVIPPVVVGYFLLVLFGRGGVLGLGLAFTWQGAALASLVMGCPLMVRAMRQAFEDVDPGLEDAAAVLGAGRLRVFLSVTAPMAIRGLIAGTLRADSGSIVVDDKQISEFSVAELSRFRISNVGQVFQAFELLNYLTVIENVMLPWHIAGNARKADMRERAMDLLRDVGLESKADTRPEQLSQGEQQRVAVCRAMLNNPLVLLADEPTGNLDQDNKQNVVDLLVEQARRNNSTLLMVTHDESLLARFDSVLDMREIAHPILATG